MVDDAKSRLMNLIIEEKVFMMGFSASGQFTCRFTVLHPNKIKAAAIGAPGYPIVPVPSWNGNTLRYCVGTDDLLNLTGANFDLSSFKTIPLYFFVGDQDTNDPVQFSDGFDQQDTDLINSLFGNTVVGRWPEIQNVYDSIGSNSTFVTYVGVGHEFTSEMTDDVFNFFNSFSSSLSSNPVSSSDGGGVGGDGGGGGGDGGGGGGGCFVSTLLK
jgi:hypothetical protein